MRIPYAVRILGKAPWYSTCAIAVLALVIALSTVVFAVVDGVLFRALPFERSQELFLLRAESSVSPLREFSPVAWQEIEGWTAANPDLSWSAIGAHVGDFPIDGIAYHSATVDERFFDTLGIRMFLGGFSQEDFETKMLPGAPREPQPVVISHRLWWGTMGGDPGALGRTLVISERVGTVFAIRIVGVLPPEFVFPVDPGDEQPDLLTPVTRTQRARTQREFRLILRVPSSVDANGVRERLASATRALAQLKVPASPHFSHRDVGNRASFDRVTLEPLGRYLAYRHRPAFRLTFAAASILLLAGCVNIAALAGARSIERQHDLRVRRALGASLWGLAKGHLLEVVILAAVATGIASVIARPLLMWTLALLPSTLTLAKVPAIDLRAFAAASTFALISIAIVAIWPTAIIATMERTSLAGIGRGIGSGGMSTRISPKSGALVIATQVGLGFVLLVAGSLTVGSLAAAWRNELGYHRERMILLEASVRRYVSLADAQQQLESAAAFIGRIPGVERSAVSTMQSTFLHRLELRSEVMPEGWKTPPDAVSVRQVSREFFEVMGLQLLEGRFPLPGEWQNGSPVAVVSVSAARGMWPNRSAIGRTLIASEKSKREDAAAWSVIGVVADARFEALNSDPVKDVYLPGAISRGRTGVLFHVRTRADAESVLPGLVRDLTVQGLRVDRAATHAQGIFESLKALALPAWLFGALAVAALVVIVIGIWGLLMMSAAQRTRELGLRMALGASRGAVVRMLIREQLVAVADGILVGAIVSAWVVTFLRSQLYGLGPYSPTAWSAAALTMLGVALVAAAIPALRATAANPADVLRVE